jgi:hypothetical protein
MSSRPGKVVSFVVYLSKTLSNSSSNSTGITKQARTSMISTGNGTRKSTTRPTSNSTNDKSTMVEVEQESLMLPQGLNCATIDSRKLNLRAFNQTVNGLE